MIFNMIILEEITPWSTSFSETKISSLKIGILLLLQESGDEFPVKL